jgi:hypothetical protein
MAHDIGHLVLDKRRDGYSDAAVVDAVLEMIAGRMEIGLPPEEWFK